MEETVETAFARTNDARPQAGESKQPPLRFADTQRLLGKMEASLGFPVITYWGSSNSNICDNDVVVLNELFKRRGRCERIGFVIKSGGGVIVSALKIVHLLRQYVDDIVALLPLDCASAATIVALGANRIVMCPTSYLTPIDSSLTHQLSPVDQINNSRVSVSSDELRRIVELWRKLERDQHPNAYQEVFRYIHPLVIGAIDRSMSLSMKICDEVLSYHTNDKALVAKVSQSLNFDYPSHSYPITSHEAKRMGLNVDTATPELERQLSQLNLLYSDMAQNTLTDIDPNNYYDNNILTIVETRNCQIFWQNERLQNYIAAERRWQTLHNRSSWRMLEKRVGRAEPIRSELHIR